LHTLSCSGKQSDNTLHKTMKLQNSNKKIVTKKFLPAQVWHREFLSMTPWRGSIRPWSFGLPPSYVSGKRMPPSVTDIRRCAKKKNKMTIISINIKSSFITPHFYTGMTHMPQSTCLEFYNDGQKTKYDFF